MRSMCSLVLALFCGPAVGCVGSLGPAGGADARPAADHDAAVSAVCPDDPDCAIPGTCRVCPDHWMCEDLAGGGRRCTNPGPEYPDGSGDWECEDVAGVTRCTGSSFPSGGGGGGWTCEQQGELVVCEDETPSYPDEGGGYRCYYSDGARVCETSGGDGGTPSGPDGGSPADGGPSGADGGTSLPDGGSCIEGQSRPCSSECGSGLQLCEAGEWSTCSARPPTAEACDNRVDDDCDGQTDCTDSDCAGTSACAPCVTGGLQCIGGGHGHCNSGFPTAGSAVACDPRNNTNGCTAEAFQAWCRSNDPAQWSRWVYLTMIDPLVRSGCYLACSGGGESRTGSDCLTPRPYWSYWCAESCASPYCITPLVLSFTPDGEVEFTASEHGFPIHPDRPGVRAADWPTGATPWLALDRNGDGIVNDGSELFGSATRLRDGRTARHGFEALAELDDDGDGWIDGSDGVWGQLLVWGDTDGDGISQAHELQPVEERGLVAIGLAYDVVPRCDPRGSCERERAVFRYRGPRGRALRGAVIDVHLRTSRTDQVLASLLPQ